MSKPPTLTEAASHIRRRLHGRAGAVVLHFVRGAFMKAEYDIQRGEDVPAASFHALAASIEREMQGQTGSVTVPYEGGIFGEPRYRTFEDAQAMPQRSA